MNYISQPLPLEGTLNTRDLGGYPLPNGDTTKLHSFLRSDALHSLTDAAKDALYEYGVRLVVDLRSSRESTAAPCALCGYRDVQVLDVPLLDNIQSSGMLGELPESLGALYISLLKDSGASLAVALRDMAQVQGCVLYNCTAGKDRTGIISMLLLTLAGVPDESVLDDYSPSADNMRPAMAKQLEVLQVRQVQALMFLFESPRSEMQKAMAWLKENYDSTPAYLRSIGVTDAEQEVLKNKLA